MKTVWKFTCGCLLATKKDDWYLYNMTGNVNLQDFTSFHTNFVDFRFQNIDFKYDFSMAGAYKIWRQLVAHCYSS